MLVFFDGCGEWFVLGDGPYAGMGLDDECISSVTISGVFELPKTNEMQIKHSGSSIVKNLLPCYSHIDGITCDGYTEKDKIYFKLHKALGFDKGLGKELGKATYLDKDFNSNDGDSGNPTEKNSTLPATVETSITNINDSILTNVDKANDNATDTRGNQLHCLVWKIREHLLENKKENEKVTTREIWSELKNNYANHDSDEIIQEITGDKIYWTSFYGNECKPLSKTSFPSLISKLKKKPPL